MEGEDRCGFTPFRAKSVDNWEDQVLYPSASTHMVDVKQETSESGYLYSRGNEEIQAPRSPWRQVLPTSSPRSCITSFSRNMLDFAEKTHLHPEHSPQVREEYIYVYIFRLLACFGNYHHRCY